MIGFCGGRRPVEKRAGRWKYAVRTDAIELFGLWKWKGQQRWEMVGGRTWADKKKKKRKKRRRRRGGGGGKEEEEEEEEKKEEDEETEKEE